MGHDRAVSGRDDFVDDSKCRARTFRVRTAQQKQAYLRTVREKINTLRGGHGTVLFFEDRSGEFETQLSSLTHLQSSKPPAIDTQNTAATLTHGQSNLLLWHNTLVSAKHHGMTLK